MVSNCQDKMETANITKIEYGTSFGSCLGYCNQAVTFMNGSIVKVLSATRSTDLVEKECSKEWEGFHSLASKVNLLSFYELEEIIGCPDCADGGAEWIEISTPEGSKKVTYEYGKEPKEVRAFISDIRKQFDELGECER